MTRWTLSPSSLALPSLLAALFLALLASPHGGTVAADYVARVELSGPVPSKAASIPRTSSSNGTEPGESCEPNCDELVRRAIAANEELRKRVDKADAASAKVAARIRERLRARDLARSLDPNKYSIGDGKSKGGMSSSLLGSGKFELVEPPSDCGHYSCITMLVQYLQKSTQRSCVASVDLMQQFKRTECAGFEIVDGTCDMPKCREIYNVRACGDVTAYQCIRNAKLPEEGGQFKCKCEAYVPPWAQEHWKLLSEEEQKRRRAEHDYRAKKQEAATKRHEAEEGAKKAKRDEATAKVKAKEEHAAKRKAREEEEKRKWGGLLDRNDKCSYGHVAVNDALGRIYEAIKKLEPKNSKLLAEATEKMDTVRTSLAADALEPPELTDEAREKKWKALFVLRSRAGALDAGNRQFLAEVLKDKYNSDKVRNEER